MKQKIIVYVMFSLILSSCGIGKGVVVNDFKKEEKGVFVDTNIIPMFKPEVLYVLAREYEKTGDTCMTMGEYVEDRLIELYPEKAYKGMMGKIGNMSMSILQKVSRGPQFREKPIDGLIYASKNESFYNSVSDSSEIDFLGMSPQEASVFCELNNLADNGILGSDKDMDSIRIFDSEWSLNRAIMSDSIPYFVQENWIMSAVSLGMATSTIYRILQSKARAEYVAKHYYGNTDLGRKGDAYKHIFVNLLLCRYTTEYGAKLIMDVYWESQNWNAPSDRIMDFHNNMVGRKYRYDEFINGSNDWRVWALRVYNFIEDSDNNATYMDWHLDTPELDVKNQEAISPKDKYIYWNKGDKTVQQYIDRKKYVEKSSLDSVK